jgi:hypothetical protein
MPSYANCRVDDKVISMTGRRADGYGFHIRSERNVPVCTFAFATEADAASSKRI